MGEPWHKISTSYLKPVHLSYGNKTVPDVCFGGFKMLLLSEEPCRQRAVELYILYLCSVESVLTVVLS